MDRAWKDIPSSKQFCKLSYEYEWIQGAMEAVAGSVLALVNEFSLTTPLARRKKKDSATAVGDLL